MNPDLQYNWNAVILGPAMVFVILLVFIFYVITLYRKNQQLHAQEKARLLEQFNSEIVRAKLEMSQTTLDRIASEIHDNIGHNLTIAGMNMIGLTCEEDENLATDTRELVQTALRDLRDLSKSLSQGYQLDLGLEAAIKRELEIMMRSFDLKCELIKLNVTDSQIVPTNSDEQEVIFFRCAQEAMSNIAKYAEASYVVISLWFDHDVCIRMEVADDGIGLDPESVTSGVGLQSMKQRMSLLGGKFEIENNRPGTKLVFALR